MNQPFPAPPTPLTPPAARFILGAFGFIFGGIGLTVIIFLWSAPFNSFHSPPLFFRIFGSFIGLAFVIFGSAMGISAIMAGRKGIEGLPSLTTSQDHPPQGQPPGRYACTRCGAPLAEKADVSPLGDTKCIHCGSWFNIHGRG